MVQMNQVRLDGSLTYIKVTDVHLIDLFNSILSVNLTNMNPTGSNMILH